MADLSTIDYTKPLGSDPVADGDNIIRETREAVKTSFNQEHTLAGPHSFVRADEGLRPAPGNLGRIFFNTLRDFIEIDTGSDWDQISSVGLFVATHTPVGAVEPAIQPTFTPILTLTPTLRASSRLIAVSVVEYSKLSNIAVDNQIHYRLTVDDVVTNILPDSDWITQLPLPLGAAGAGEERRFPTIGFWYYNASLGGTHTVKYEHKVDAFDTTGNTAYRKAMMALFIL